MDTGTISKLISAVAVGLAATAALTAIARPLLFGLIARRPRRPSPRT